MGKSLADYEVRLHRSDNSLSMTMMVFARNDAEAAVKARGMLRGGISNAHIYQDGMLVDTVYAMTPIRVRDLSAGASQ